MKVLIKFCIICCSLVTLLLASSARAARAPLELDKVTNLLKWSDIVVTGVKDQVGRGITFENVILNKRPDIVFSGKVELEAFVEYEHMSPVIMRGYRYLFFLSLSNSQESGEEPKDKVVCKITAGANGMIALFNQDELKNHSRVLRMERIMPNYDRIKLWKKRLLDNFGTEDGIEIKKAVEDLVVIYNEEDSKAQILLLIEGLNKGNPAMARFCKELLADIELEPID